jgi:hypothetical protein
MKKILLLTLLLSFSAQASRVFIEPSIFVNMFQNEKLHYDDGSNKYDGVIRNDYLSFALKFGVHFGHWEVGFESEIYRYVAHLEGNGAGDSVLPMNVTYNSIFFGYEFMPHQYLYLSMTAYPYMASGSTSLIEEKNQYGLEYSYHIKDWVSLNAKIEMASHFTDRGSPEKKIELPAMMLVGFSFPINADY